MINSNALIPNNIFQPNNLLTGTLCLSQIEGFEPVSEFTDSAQTKWHLVKSAFNSCIEIPNPKNVQIVNYWNHAFPNLKENVYIYVVEGIKQPTVETERPSRIMYQWFSIKNIPSFMPSMITDLEWKKANVYGAEIADTRVSQLYALCKISNNTPIEETNTDLIKVTGINESNTNTKA